MMDGRVAILLFLSIYFGFLIRVNLMLFQCSILFFGCILPPTSLQYLFLLILPANYHWIQDMIKRASLSLMRLVSLMNLFVFKCDLLHLSSNVLSCIVLSFINARADIQLDIDEICTYMKIWSLLWTYFDVAKSLFYGVWWL